MCFIIHKLQRFATLNFQKDKCRPKDAQFHIIIFVQYFFILVQNIVRFILLAEKSASFHW